MLSLESTPLMICTVTYKSQQSLKFHAMSSKVLSVIGESPSFLHNTVNYDSCILSHVLNSQTVTKQAKYMDIFFNDLW